MKHKRLLIIILTITILGFILGMLYHFRDRKTYSLNLPELEDLKSIILEQNNKKQVISDKVKMQDLLDNINLVKRVTQIESIQDAPINVKNNISVCFVFNKSGVSTIFIYKRKNKYYIEQPYNGIYEISQDEYNSISEYLIKTPISWDEITPSGVDEDMFLENLDIDLLKTIASEFQTLVNEEMEKEKKDPESILRGEWLQVFESERYKKIVNMGDVAMKPLYWIIYKSENSGLYEYICSMALSEIYGLDKDNTLSWATSKEFLKLFTDKILEGKFLDN